MTVRKKEKRDAYGRIKDSICSIVLTNSEIGQCHRLLAKQGLFVSGRVVLVIKENWPIVVVFLYCLW
jgi:hypothetical protein